jgi:hypothetical protein
LKASVLRLRGCLIQARTFSIKKCFVLGGQVDARDLRIIDGGTLDAQGNVKINDSGVLNLSYLAITGVPLDQDDLSPLNLDEAEISGGTVKLEHIKLTTGRDRPEITWSGGQEERGGQFIASFQRLILTGGEISFRETTLPYGELSFSEATFTGGVLDFEYARLRDCHLDFTAATIDGGCLNFSNSHIGVSRSSNVSPRSGFVYEWLESLRNMEHVSNRDMVWKKSPSGVVSS